MAGPGPPYGNETMKFSENWLRSHVPTQATRDELAATLTAIGLEVEEVAALGDGLANVVVARIVECAKHPEADRLQVCQVDAGQSGLLQIVCGAPNARPGLLAPLAMVGANVGGIAIKAAKPRGVESNGMLCSAKELGIDADASGLLELPADAPVGTSVADYLGLPDASIEIKLTPNRADCFSVRGIAYDVAASLGSEVKPLDAAPVPAQSPVTMDVALEAGQGREVMPDSPLVGDATLLVMPSLDAANISYNLLKVAAGGNIAIGPILLGADKPVHILTASTTVRRIVNMTALAVADANAPR